MSIDRGRPAARRRAQRAAIAAIGLGVASTGATPASADGVRRLGLGRPSEPVVPLESVRSIRILRDDEPIFDAPAGSAKRRGAAERSATLPLLEWRSGPDCGGPWGRVGVDAWVCSDHVLKSPERPAPRSPARSNGSGLPYDYFFVGPDGSFGYEKLGTAEEVAPDAELQPGFAVAVIQVASKSGGDPFGLTTKGLWLPMRDLRPAQASAFAGAELADGKLSGGWVINERVRAYAEPAGRVLSEPALPRLARIQVQETRQKAGRAWVRVDAGRWLKASDVALETPAEPPAGLSPNERWIDVDLSNQVLTAYVGARPVFTTLVSTGRGKGDHPEATPRGAFRIWVKLRTSDMTNLENEEANRYYAMEEVPWVMFFNKGYGLHGAYWHQSFGRVRSHGCVNLSPLDARRLFDFADPPLPDGWSAVLPTESAPGTLVRVR